MEMLGQISHFYPILSLVCIYSKAFQYFIFIKIIVLSLKGNPLIQQQQTVCKENLN